jgi:hypothetical protein
MKLEPLLYTMGETAKALRMSPKLLRAHCEAGHLSAVK